MFKEDIKSANKKYRHIQILNNHGMIFWALHITDPSSESSITVKPNPCCKTNPDNRD